MDDVISILKDGKILTESGNINNNTKKILRNTPILRDIIVKNTPFVVGDVYDTYIRRIRCIVDKLTTEPSCMVCGAPVKLSGKVYLKYCSSLCSNSDPERKERIKKTNGVRFGGPAPMCSASVQHKARQTNLDKYGVPYHQLSAGGKLKRETSCLHQWGVRTPFESTHIQNKAKQSTKKKYGNESFNTSTLSTLAQQQLSDKSWLETQHNTKQIPIYEIANTLGVSSFCVRYWMEKHKITAKRFYTSLHQKQISDFLEQMTPVVQNDRSLIHPQELDLWLPQHNIAIEVNGVFWHSELNGKDKTYHLNKTNACKELNIRLIHTTDLEWELKNEIVRSRLTSILGKNPIVIYARNCEVRQITNTCANQFLQKTHLQSSALNSIALGLFNKTTTELVSVMTFGKPRFERKHQWEIIRFSSSLNTTVVGGANKMFSWFVQNYSPSSVISYSDIRWNTGGVYEKLGFTKTHSSNPSYHYFHKNNPHELFHRAVFQKHMLVTKLDQYDPQLSEWKNMVNAGYDRIWDCGHDVWSWKRAC